jgi:hypothetical protein
MIAFYFTKVLPSNSGLHSINTFSRLDALILGLKLLELQLEILFKSNFETNIDSRSRTFLFCLFRIHFIRIHPHGILYTKMNEGAPYNDGTSIQDDFVGPTEEKDYTWLVPERAGKHYITPLYVLLPKDLDLMIHPQSFGSIILITIKITDTNAGLNFS